ncbi:MAG: hypothetical protein U9N73_02525 [Candidatus Auribacterota bacterium]|nr:hypothetical protein [Candidatus Auribacterota bacterium]
MADVVFRDVRLDEVPAVGELFHTQWRENHIFYREPRVLEWQYHQNPYAKIFSRDLTLLGAFIDDRLAGVHGYIPFIFNRYGERQYGCHFCNWYAAPELRKGPWGIRLITDIIKLLPMDAWFGFGFTGMSRPILARIGWKIESAFPRYLRILDPAKCRELVKDQAEFLPFVEKFSGDYLSRTYPDKEDVIRIEEVDDIPGDRWDEFYWQEIAPFFVGPAREERFLIWRYKEIPIFKYRFLIAREDNQIKGLLVFRVEEVKKSVFKVIRIMDLIAKPPVSGELIDKVLEIAVVEEAALIDFFCTSSIYDNELRDRDFVFSQGDGSYPFPFLFQPIEPGRLTMDFGWQISGDLAESEECRRDLYYTKADGDLDRPN